MIDLAQSVQIKNMILSFGWIYPIGHYAASLFLKARAS